MPGHASLDRPIRRSGRRAAYRVATSDRLERAVMASATRRHAAFRRARRYVAGIDDAAAIARVEALRSDGLHASVDLFGEDVEDAATADALVERYRALATRLASPAGTHLSLDCSHLGLTADRSACGARIEAIAGSLPAGMRLQLGAEQSGRADAILEIALAAAGRGLPVMATVQANLCRSAADVERLTAAGVPIRLVKGAYVEDLAIAYPWGPETDGSFIELARSLTARQADHSLATHDPAILERLLPAAGGPPVEHLLGVRPEAARRLAATGREVRIYVPFGTRWFRYAARRAAESIGV